MELPASLFSLKMTSQLDGHLLFPPSSNDPAASYRLSFIMRRVRELGYLYINYCQYLVVGCSWQTLIPLYFPRMQEQQLQQLEKAQRQRDGETGI